MFNVGGAELFIILLLALVVLGPDKLPGAMRTVGQWAGEMRKMANGFQNEVNKAMADPLDVKGAEKTSGPAKAGDQRPEASSSDEVPSSNGAVAGPGTNGVKATEAGEGDEGDDSASGQRASAPPKVEDASDTPTGDD